jgi:hypothetical protein
LAVACCSEVGCAGSPGRAPGDACWFVRYTGPEGHRGKRAQHDDKPSAGACRTLIDDVVAF